MKVPKLILWFIIFVLFLIDRLFKNFVLHLTRIVSDEFFSFTPFINKAGPFSLILPNIFLMITACLILIWLIYIGWQATKQNIFLRLAGSSLMLIGGFSNLWDRLLIGGVIDYWHISIMSGMNFNLADAYLLIGVLLVIKSYYTKSIKVLPY